MKKNIFLSGGRGFNNTNADDIVNTGCYYIAEGNINVDPWGLLIVLDVGENIVVQIQFDFYLTHCKMRIRKSNGWSVWKQLFPIQ